MTAPRFLGIDLTTRPDLQGDGVILMQRVRCPGRRAVTFMKTPSCGTSERSPAFIIVDEAGR